MTGTATPIGRAERITNLDTVRGVATLGIVAMNDGPSRTGEVEHPDHSVALTKPDRERRPGRDRALSSVLVVPIPSALPGGCLAAEWSHLADIAEQTNAAIEPAEQIIEEIADVVLNGVAMLAR